MANQEHLGKQLIAANRGLRGEFTSQNIYRGMLDKESCRQAKHITSESLVELTTNGIPVKLMQRQESTASNVGEQLPGYLQLLLGQDPHVKHRQRPQR